MVRASDIVTNSPNVRGELDQLPAVPKYRLRIPVRDNHDPHRRFLRVGFAEGGRGEGPNRVQQGQWGLSGTLTISISQRHFHPLLEGEMLPMWQHKNVLFVSGGKRKDFTLFGAYYRSFRSSAA